MKNTLFIFLLLPIISFSQKKVQIDNQLEVINADSAGVSIYSEVSNNNATAIHGHAKANNNTGSTPNIAIKGTCTQSNNSGESYAGYFSASGRNSYGLFASVSNYSNGGSSYGGYFKSTLGSNSVYGGALTAFSEGAGWYGYGGSFEATHSAGKAIIGIASSGSLEFYNHVNYGGHFTSSGNRGVAVFGYADNETTENVNYGGKFVSKGVMGYGLSSTSPNYAIQSIGKLIIEGSNSNDAILEMSTGTAREVIKLEDVGDNLLIGDIIGNGGDVILKSAGHDKLKLLNSGEIELLGNANITGVTKILDSTAPELIFERTSGGSYDAKIRVGSTGHMYFEGGADLLSGLITNMTLRSNGRLGIREDNPDKEFHLKGQAKIEAYNIDSDANLFMQSGNGVETRVITYQNSTDNIYMGDINGVGSDVFLRAAGNDVLVLGSSGNIAVKDGNLYTETGTNSLGSSGSRWSTAWLTNPINSSSDVRLKKNILNLDYGLEALMQLRPVSYEWKVNNAGTKLGLIAQELLQIIPEVVHVPDNPEEFMSVAYSELIPVLINAIQNQQKIIDNQAESIAELQDLKKEFEFLKTMFTSMGEESREDKKLNK